MFKSATAGRAALSDNASLLMHSFSSLLYLLYHWWLNVLLHALFYHNVNVYKRFMLLTLHTDDIDS